MDHSEAVRLQAAEKYVLGELAPELLEQYEEHYFDCEECANDLKAAAVFTEAARDLFRKESRKKENERAEVGRWFSWLRPSIAGPALATLLLIVCYQSFVTIPKLQRRAVTLAAVQSADLISLIGANSRSEGVQVVQIHQDRPSIVELDVPASGEFASYLCQIQDASGRTTYETSVTASEAKSTVHLILPKGSLEAGKYSLVILGVGSPSAPARTRNELERLAFSVEMLS